MKERHIMLDIETLGNGSNACVASIGAVEFCAKNFELGETFQKHIYVEDAAKYGTIDASTVRWWLLQEPEAQRRTFVHEFETYDLRPALELLHLFVEGSVDRPKGYYGVWGNGATFDNVILHNAAKAVGLEPLWSFRFDRDLRTLRYLNDTLGLNAEEPIMDGTPHVALDDAIWQARYACNIMKVLRSRNEIATIGGLAKEKAS